MMPSSLARARAALLTLAVFAGTTGCVERERFAIGEDCVYPSDCDPSLVCAIGRCRVECVGNRDCAAGLTCLPDPQTMVSGCQVDDEATCIYTSDCPASLVCRFATCTNECVSDEDCATGSICEPQDAGGVCHAPPGQLCVYNSDCPPGMVCGPGQVCYVECQEDRDCTAPRTCDLVSHLCTWARDAGTP